MKQKPLRLQREHIALLPISPLSAALRDDDERRERRRVALITLVVMATISVIICKK